MLFQDRADAGDRLAPLLFKYRDQHPIVLGLPRGGVVVAYEVARALGAPLDVWLARKIGAAGQPELAVGAVAEGGEIFLDRDMMERLGIREEEALEIAAEKAFEVKHLGQRFRRGRPPPEVRGRVVVLVDDGIATGATVKAAARALRRQAVKWLVIATPVGAASTLESLWTEADDVVCLSAEPYLGAIGAFYVDFRQTSDEEVIALLDRAWQAHAAAEVTGENTEGDRGASDVPVLERNVRMRAGMVTLEGDLAMSPQARGIVLFVHGSGSSRRSPRNRFVAEMLQRAGLATLLFDLLTAREAAQDEFNAQLRFDIARLAQRLIGVTDWVHRSPSLSHLKIGYFGASTGAAAALVAAVERPEVVGAIVSRGGRPDLAGNYLERVQAPVLLVVGAEDTQVLELNRDALARLHVPKRLAVIPGATHLFEEPGALREVARLAADWFVHYLFGHSGCSELPGAA